MSTKQITEYNKNALKNSGIELNNNIGSPVLIKMDFADYEDLSASIWAVLEAIEVIAYSGSHENLSVCGSLAGLCKQLLPHDELAFLDKLLIKRKDTAGEFSKI
ncbi:hypothetical protein IUY40_18845 [Flavobacterium sp. ALJ2]|uniref:hypothetical protein n=1 Tax=Flavobacterium sp. ALJ2 TaxID=2786960 RepID=UPI0018A0BBB5|nr:hypothetical protein [Flavobacterium sp. ALJ2]MBF7093593.1 hypothetical protein [Flavobacterium sp. ALJ2]